MNERSKRMTRRGIVLIAVGLTIVARMAVAQSLPQYSKDSHLGVASCATSFCHGSATQRTENNVFQNEYHTWLKGGDKHSGAYRLLLGDSGKRIARYYFGPGGKPGHTQAECLDCHADNVASEKRGPQFHLDNGVGCEACHGGSERWIRGHYGRKNSHADSLAKGLYPTENPEKRAELCLSCHLGTSRKFVNHRMMGAGHPRLRFELDLFTEIQPAHYAADEDYGARKPVSNGVKTWAVGQAVNLRRFLSLLRDPKRNRDGAFPELVFFECHSCHHPLETKAWRPRPGSGLGPGAVHLNDANLIMLGVIARHLAPKLAKTLAADTRALLKGVSTSPQAMIKAAGRLDKTVIRLLSAIGKSEFPRDSMRALFVGLLDQGLAGEYTDFAAAEQATMALGSIHSALRQVGAVTGPAATGVEKALDGCFAVLDPVIEKKRTFDPSRFQAALKTLKKALPADDR